MASWWHTLSRSLSSMCHPLFFAMETTNVCECVSVFCNLYKYHWMEWMDERTWEYVTFTFGHRAPISNMYTYLVIENGKNMQKLKRSRIYDEIINGIVNFDQIKISWTEKIKYLSLEHTINVNAVDSVGNFFHFSVSTFQTSIPIDLTHAIHSMCFVIQFDPIVD